MFFCAFYSGLMGVGNAVSGLFKWVVNYKSFSEKNIFCSEAMARFSSIVAPLLWDQSGRK